MIKNALALLGNYDRCHVVVADRKYEGFWSTELECWFCVGPTGPCYFLPEQVEEWMPIVVRPGRSKAG